MAFGVYRSSNFPRRNKRSHVSLHQLFIFTLSNDTSYHRIEDELTLRPSSIFGVQWNPFNFDFAFIASISYLVGHAQNLINPEDLKENRSQVDGLIVGIRFIFISRRKTVTNYTLIV